MLTNGEVKNTQKSAPEYYTLPKLMCSFNSVVEFKNKVKQKVCKKYVYKVDIFVTYRLFIQKLFPFSMFLVFNLYICVLQLLLYTFVAKDPLDFETLLYTRITTHIVLHINRAWHIIIKIFTVASFIFSLLKIRSKPPYGVIPCRNRIKKIHDNVRNYGLLVGSFRP